MRKNKSAHSSKRGVESTSADPANNSSAETSPLIIPSSNDSLVYPCTQWKEKLISTHHDDLSSEDRIELEKHLEKCSSCSAIRRHDRVIDSLIRQLPFREQPLFETESELPPVLQRLWEFEDMQRRIPEKETGESISSEEAQLAELLLGYEITSKEEDARQTFESKRTKLVITRYRIVILSTLVLAVIFSTFFSNTTLLRNIFVVVIVAIIPMTAVFVWLLMDSSLRGKTDVAQKRKRIHQTLRELVLL